MRLGVVIEESGEGHVMSPVLSGHRAAERVGPGNTRRRAMITKRVTGVLRGARRSLSKLSS